MVHQRTVLDGKAVDEFFIICGEDHGVSVQFPGAEPKIAAQGSFGTAHTSVTVEGDIEIAPKPLFFVDVDLVGEVVGGYRWPEQPAAMRVKSRSRAENRRHFIMM